MRRKIHQSFYSTLFIILLGFGFFLNFFIELFLLVVYLIFWFYNTYREPILKGHSEIKNEKNKFRKFSILSIRTFEFFILVFCPVVLLPILKKFLNWSETKIKIQQIKKQIK